jgi:hypothetical protein
MIAARNRQPVGNNSSMELTEALSEASRRALFSDWSRRFARFPPSCSPDAEVLWPFLARAPWKPRLSGRISSPNTVQNAIVTKTVKDAPGPFPKPAGVGTYPSHPRPCPGRLLRKSPDGIDRRPRALAETHSGSAFEGAQWFIAGWSSPVARQAHNLKVIGSNPIPATKINKPLKTFLFSEAFVFNAGPRVIVQVAPALRAMNVSGLPSFGSTKMMSVGSRRGVSMDRKTTGWSNSSGIAWMVPRSKNNN